MDVHNGARANNKWGQRVSVSEIRACLVAPAKGLTTPPAIEVQTLTAGDRVYALVEKIYERSFDECKVELISKPDDSGNQNNEARDLFLNYAKLPDDAGAKNIAQRLASFTTNRSGDGLLFLAVGNEGGKCRLVLSRFPAEEAVLVEKNSSGRMSLKFTNDVFMKSTTAYKCAVYEDPISPKAFLKSRAIDKQINHELNEISEYWINGFLKCSLAVTDAQGTKQFAKAMREAIRSAENDDMKGSLIAAVTLAGSLKGRILNADTAATFLSLDDDAKQHILDQFPNKSAAQQNFRFDANEFSNHLAYRAVFLDTGVMVSADAVNFNDRVSMDKDGEKTKISAIGKIVDTKIRKTQ